MTKATETAVDNAGTIIANEAMRLVAKHPAMTPAHIDAVIAALKAAAPGIVDRLVADVAEAPTVGQYAVQAAILELAGAGIKALKA